MNALTPSRALPIAFFALLGVGLALKPSQQAAPYEAEPVSGNVHWIEGAMGGNVAVSVGADGAFVIDCYVPNAKEAYEKAVASTIGEAEVRMVLNTHWHGDHTGNNASFGKEATILAHENVRRRLVGDTSIEGRTQQGTPPAALPTLTYENGVTLHLNGERVRVQHFANGHTDGDSVAFFEGSQVLHMGDLFFNGRFPYIDLDSGGSVDGYIEAVEAVREQVSADWTLIPGHGGLAKKADLEAFLAMLKEARGLVKESLEGGLTLEEMKSEDLLGHLKDWEWGFIKRDGFLEILVRSLQ